MATFDGNELPKMTIKLREDFENALNSGANDREICTNMLKVLKEILPVDYIVDRCGGETVDTVDIIEVSLLAEDVWDAYNRPLVEAQMERQRRDFEALEPMLESARLIGQLNSQGMMKQTPTRAKFNRVK